MSDLAYQLAKLTAKSKQIDGMGFGGSGKNDSLDVAAALGMHNPETGNKLQNYASELGMLKFGGMDERSVKASKIIVINRLFKMLRLKRCKVKPVTLKSICGVALNDYIAPNIKFNKSGKMQVDSNGEPIIKSRSKANMARNIGIAGSCFTATHQGLLDSAFWYLSGWESDASQHLTDSLK
jgi:hypothetical protein